MELIKIKVAFIPPKGLTDYASRGDIIMCLAQELDDPEYSAAMHPLCNNMYTLLDNGANEGCALSSEALAVVSKRVQADEIVLPDVLGNALDTYAASTEYLKHCRMPEQQYMGVVQGSTYPDLQDLIDKYAKVQDIVTIGIPRLLVDRLHMSARINLATWTSMEYPKRFAIHFLGASGTWVKEPYYVAKYGLPVRSIDTSLPFNYGLAGVLLSDSKGTTTRKIDRPRDYFTRVHTRNARTTVMANMEIYKEWCSGKKTPSGEL